MLLKDFDKMIREFLDIDRIDSSDLSLNGLQVSRSKEELRKIAFAVDASMESFKRANARDADLLFVHHGLFWGRPYRLTGSLYNRIRFLIKNDLALYAVHLPLDMHPETGNNIGIVKMLNLESVEPFGDYHGLKIGYRGLLPSGKTMDEIANLITGQNAEPVTKLAFGPEIIKSIGIVSGGAPEVVTQAIDENLDLYITGDASHTVYHESMEGRINVLFAGHYATETWGIKLIKKKIEKETDLNTIFIDIPTGL